MQIKKYFETIKDYIEGCPDMCEDNWKNYPEGAIPACQKICQKEGKFLEDFASQGNLLCLHNLRHARPSSVPQDNRTKKAQTSYAPEKVTPLEYLKLLFSQ